MFPSEPFSGVFAPFLETRPIAKSKSPTDSQPPSREGGFFYSLIVREHT